LPTMIGIAAHIAIDFGGDDDLPGESGSSSGRRKVQTPSSSVPVRTVSS
jgi:hypothetical protein